jgi:hypothetical protein
MDQLARAIVAQMEVLYAELQASGASKESKLVLGMLKTDMERFAANLRAHHPPAPSSFMSVAPERLDGHIN